MMHNGKQLAWIVAACAALVAMRRGAIEAPLRRLGAVGFTDNPRVLASILTEVEAALFRRFGADTDPPPPPPDAVPEPDERVRRGNAKRLAARGLSRLEKGDAPGAWPLLVVAAQKNPSLRNVFAYLGFAAFDLGKHDEALGYLGYMDMLTRFFTNKATSAFYRRQNPSAEKWRIRGHAKEAFWQWVVSWARAARRPMDLGFDDDGFILPPLKEKHTVIHRGRYDHQKADNDSSPKGYIGGSEKKDHACQTKGH